MPVDVLGRSPKSIAFGTLEARQAFAAERDQGVLGQRRPVLERHERLRNFAPQRVGDGDDGDFKHGGMLIDRSLDLDRRDVLAAADDDVLQRSRSSM